MGQYCTLKELQDILPETVVIGKSLLSENVKVLESTAIYWITRSSDIIDSYVTTIYRIPLVKYKEPDYSQDPVTFTELYPSPVVLICARLAAGNLYDHIMMAQETPNVSEWGKNQRSLAFDDLAKIQAGEIQLKNQDYVGLRFVRQELHDPPRVPVTIKSGIDTTKRSAGE